ncbi:MAG: glycosyltransferase [Dehalococcoidia bacterium]
MAIRDKRSLLRHTSVSGNISSEASPELTVIIPTYNERENIRTLVEQTLEVLQGTHAEVIVVDDGSPDGTRQTVAELAEADTRISLLERDGKQGLAGAVFAGAAAARGRFAAVMDADLSHDPEELPDMLAKAREGYDVVIGSRFVQGSAFVDQPMGRQLLSRVLNMGARVALQLSQHDVLTGFALCRRDLITEMPTRYSANGFKWLVELLATRRGLRVYELPIVFHDRGGGASKATPREALSFGVLCARLTLWRMRRLLRRG